ncbi:MAG: adenylate/guanylate cyclase domain-containing protein [Magnetococcales bacterium]|nr:adenylate/guanylate cyclase domain-containing protein [Magnetococcales bacterium]
MPNFGPITSKTIFEHLCAFLDGLPTPSTLLLNFTDKRRGGLLHRRLFNGSTARIEFSLTILTAIFALSFGIILYLQGIKIEQLSAMLFSRGLENLGQEALARANFLNHAAWVLFLSIPGIGFIGGLKRKLFTLRLMYIVDVMKKITDGDHTQRIHISPGNQSILYTHIGRMINTLTDTLNKEEAGREQANAKLLKSLDQERATTQRLDKANRVIRHTFGRYMSPDVMEAILDRPDGLKLGGKKMTVTVMMTDLRGFTSISDRMDSEQLLSMLNMYLEVMTKIILDHKGTIIEFLGDGILMLFGAPFNRPDDPQRAVRCALKMQKSMEQVNRRNRKHGFPELAMGVGITTGDVVAGNIGSNIRSKYGVVGTSINLAARIESLTVGGQILISMNTYLACENLLRIGQQFDTTPKGFKKPIAIYEVTGIGGTYDLYLDVTKNEHLAPVSPAKMVRFSLLRNKYPDAICHDGWLTSLTLPNAEIRTITMLDERSDIQIQLFDNRGVFVSDQLYGKVTAVDRKKKILEVTFTSVHPDARAYIESDRF